MGCCTSDCCLGAIPVVAACVACCGKMALYQGSETDVERARREMTMKFGRTDIQTTPNVPRQKKKKNVHTFVDNNKLSD